jgi:hypothetical protein
MRAHIHILGRTAAIAGLLAVSACTGSTDFTITKTFNANATGGVAYSYEQAVDLAADAPDAWKHRKKVKSLDLVGLDGTITAANPATGVTGGGSIVLRPDGGTGSTDATVGTWPTTEPVVAMHSLSVTLSPAAVAVIENAIKGNGRFSVLLTGTTSANTVFTADVSLHLKLKFKVP